MDKRRHDRTKVNNLVADISDGVGFFSGTIGDISHYGLLLDDIPNKLNDQAMKLTVIVSANGKNFKMIAIPKWVDENNRSKSMGIEILNPSPKWSDFVKQHEPTEIDDDIWTSVPTTH